MPKLTKLDAGLLEMAAREWLTAEKIRLSPVLDRREDDWLGVFQKDAAAVNRDLSSVELSTPPPDEEVTGVRSRQRGPTADAPHLTAGRLRSLLRSLAKGVDRDSRARRERYLFWMLGRLQDRGLLSFDLPVMAGDRPSRLLAFDPVDRSLPSPTRFRRWQSHLAALAVRTTVALPANEDRGTRREWATVAALLAFGGPCGRRALDELARLKVEDLDLRGGRLYLRDSDGTRTVLWSLHPAQRMALIVYAREGGPGRFPATGRGRRDAGTLFPGVGGRPGVVRFRKWLERELRSADEGLVADDPAAVYNARHVRPGLESLKSGARRWMLELYPVYLVSVLAGSYGVADAAG